MILRRKTDIARKQRDADLYFTNKEVEGDACCAPRRAAIPCRRRQHPGAAMN